MANRDSTKEVHVRLPSDHASESVTPLPVATGLGGDQVRRGLSFTIEDLQMAADDFGGFCLACGEIAYGVEPFRCNETRSGPLQADSRQATCLQQAQPGGKGPGSGRSRITPAGVTSLQRGVECDDCGAHDVYSALELLLSGRVKPTTLGR